MPDKVVARALQRIYDHRKECFYEPDQEFETTHDFIDGLIALNQAVDVTRTMSIAVPEMGLFLPSDPIESEIIESPEAKSKKGRA